MVDASSELRYSSGGESLQRCVMSVLNLLKWKKISRIANAVLTILSGMYVTHCSDFNFWRVEGRCVLLGPDPNQPSFCKTGEKYKGSSGYRKISLSKCKDGDKLDTQIDRQCNDFTQKEGEIDISSTLFDDKLGDFLYFKWTNGILMKDQSARCFFSKNAGKTWERFTHTEAPVVQIQQDDYRGNRAYVLTTSNEIWFSDNNGTDYQKISTPVPPNSLIPPVLKTHPTESGYLLWTGSVECENLDGNCHTETFYSIDHGKNWRSLITYARNCQFGLDAKFLRVEKDSIFCDAYKDQSGDQSQKHPRSHPIALKKTVNWGSEWSVVLDEVIGFATFETYMIAAKVYYKLTI